MDPDAIIIGGGPAGTVTALHAARAGLRILLLERTHYESPRIGESLAPTTVAALTRLGIEPGRLPVLPSPGTLSLWEMDKPVESDFLFQRGGDGWHVDRRALDAACADLAEAAGARVLRGVRLESVGRIASGWKLASSAGSFQSRWLVDATGRAGWLRHRLGIVTRSLDDLIAVSARGPRQHPDQRLVVEAVADGWWYYAPLPDGECIAVWLSDADLMPRDRAARTSAWQASLASTRLIRERFTAPHGVTLRTTAAGETYAESVIGDGWLMVGDTALAPDPLAGSGVLQAINGAAHAARTMTSQRVSDYELFLNTLIKSHISMRAVTYERVRRWPDACFWKRRHRSVTTERGLSAIAEPQVQAAKVDAENSEG